MAVIDYDTVNGRLIGEEGPNGRIDYQVDALGSVVGTMDSSGSAQKVYRYKPSGAILNDSGPGTEPMFRWVGTRGYRLTSLAHSDYYIRRRHYGISAGMWTTADPLWPGQPAYQYSRSAPTSGVDPSGLCQINSFTAHLSKPVCSGYILGEFLWLAVAKPISFDCVTECGVTHGTLGACGITQVASAVATLQYGSHPAQPLLGWDTNGYIDDGGQCAEESTWTLTYVIDHFQRVDAPGYSSVIRDGCTLSAIQAMRTGLASSATTPQILDVSLKFKTYCDCLPVAGQPFGAFQEYDWSFHYTVSFIGRGSSSAVLFGGDCPTSSQG